jgi:hypothetical protein
MCVTATSLYFVIFVSDVRHCDVIVFRHFLSVTFVVVK